MIDLKYHLMKIKLMHKEMVASCRMAVFAMTILPNRASRCTPSLWSQGKKFTWCQYLVSMISSTLLNVATKKTQSTKHYPELGFPKNQFS